MSHIRIISAGAGSGKTYRLTSEMVQLLKDGVRPSGIIATTFTRKAAAELQERVRVRLLEAGLSRQADELTNALIGTVHSLGVKLLQRFAFEAGVSPQVQIIAEEDQQTLFNNSLAMVLGPDRVDAIDRLCRRLGMHSRQPTTGAKNSANSPTSPAPTPSPPIPSAKAASIPGTASRNTCPKPPPKPNRNCTNSSNKPSTSPLPPSKTTAMPPKKPPTPSRNGKTPAGSSNSTATCPGAPGPKLPKQKWPSKAATTPRPCST
jgi:hypothetical protein